MSLWLGLLFAEVGINTLVLLLLSRKGKKKQLEMYLYPDRFTPEERGRWELIPEGFTKRVRIGAYFFLSSFKRKKSSLREPLAEALDSEDAIMYPHEDSVTQAKIKEVTDKLDKAGNLDFMPTFIKGFILSLAALAFAPKAYAWVSLIPFLIVMGYFWVNVLLPLSVPSKKKRPSLEAEKHPSLFAGDWICDVGVGCKPYQAGPYVDSELRNVKRKKRRK